MPEGIVHDLEVVEVDEEHGKGVAWIATRAFCRVAQPLDKACTVGQSGESVVQGIVSELPLDALRFHCPTLELDFRDRRSRDLGDMFDLVLRPVPRDGTERKDEGQRLP